MDQPQIYAAVARQSAKAVVAGDITMPDRAISAQTYQVAQRASRHGPSRPMRPCLTHRLACALNEVKGSCGR